VINQSGNAARFRPGGPWPSTGPAVSWYKAAGARAQRWLYRVRPWSRRGEDRVEDANIELYPFAGTRFIVLDLETTGLDVAADEILAVGAVVMMGSRILVGQTFYRLVRPQRASWSDTVLVHHILPADVAGAPPLEEVLPSFQAFCSGDILVGHSLELDRAFLMRAAEERDQKLVASAWIDVERVARWLARQGRGLPRRGKRKEAVTLSALASQYGIKPLQRHHALADALTTAQIWQRQLAALWRHGVREVRDLIRVGEV